MNAFQLLKNDHRIVSDLFDAIESASGGRKTQLFTRLKSELDVHADIEEKIFYPALENKQESREITLEAYEEHKVVKDLLAELASGSAGHDEWDAKLKVLRENVDHHVKEEEGELFDKANDVLSDENLDRIGEQMETEKARQLRQAPPRAGRSAAKRGTPKSTGSRKQTDSPGVLGRLASLVGLGSSQSAAKAGRKSSSKAASKGGKKAAKGSKGRTAKKSTTKAGAKKSGAKKSTKAGSKATKGGSKARGSRAAASKRSAKKSTKSSRAAKRKTGGSKKR